MEPMRRIMVVGCPGGGKSTLSLALGEKLGLPVVHLDKLFHKPGWQEGDREAFDGALADACARDAWVIDGNYARTLEMRMGRADTVVWVDRSRIACLWRIVRRVLTSYGRVRVDMADGCPERFDPEFMRYVWDFQRDQEPALRQALARHADTVRLVRLQSDAEAQDFLDSAR